MASTENNVEVKHFSGTLSEHFVYKLNAQFDFRGSNTYHLQHTHPLKYQDVADSDRQKSSDLTINNKFLVVSVKACKRQTFCRLESRFSPLDC